MGRSARRAVALVLLFGLVACSNGSDRSDQTAATGGNPSVETAKSTDCTPFGNPPRDVVADVPPGESIPLCVGGRMLGPWQDSDGADRYACLYEPPGASKSSPLPMLVFIHPSLAPADAILATNILELEPVTSLAADPAQTGFIVLSPQGRSTKHFYPSPDDRGIGWDNWYRQLNPDGDAFVGGRLFRENVDAASIDHFIAAEVATGRVDTNRIFLSGWSNGSAMSILYGLSRPGIASIAVYSAPDPFHAFNDPCPQQPVIGEPDGGGQVQIFNERLPILHVHNDCDIAGICPNGERMAEILGAQGIAVEDVLVDSLLLPASGSCLDVCGTDPDGYADVAASPFGITLGSANHLRWPQPSTIEMLQFLREHPLEGKTS